MFQFGQAFFFFQTLFFRALFRFQPFLFFSLSFGEAFFLGFLFLFGQAGFFFPFGAFGCFLFCRQTIGFGFPFRYFPGFFFSLAFGLGCFLRCFALGFFRCLFVAVVDGYGGKRLPVVIIVGFGFFYHGVHVAVVALRFYCFLAFLQFIYGRHFLGLFRRHLEGVVGGFILSRTAAGKQRIFQFVLSGFAARRLDWLGGQYFGLPTVFIDADVLGGIAALVAAVYRDAEYDARHQYHGRSPYQAAAVFPF